ncbi:cyclic nucleotide-binding domain-containing protein, partial [Cylindrospermopsis raciborskii CS-506_A]|nr:cyclic nucleotide-binding domain-containing protein [Cylindrospermopsis raciborskii CS-506_A]
MNYSSQEFSEFLQKIPGFEKLSPTEINHLLSKQQALRYRLG